MEDSESNKPKKLGYLFAESLGKMKEYQLMAECTKPKCGFKYTDKFSDENKENAVKNCESIAKLIHSEHKDYIKVSG